MVPPTTTGAKQHRVQSGEHVNDDQTNEMQAATNAPAPEAAPEAAPTNDDRTVPLAALEAMRAELKEAKAWRIEREAADAEAERLKAEAELTLQQKFDALQAKHDELAAWRASTVEAETARKAKVAEANALAIKNLPPEFQSNPGLKSDDPDAVAATLTWMKSIGQTSVAVGAGPRPAGNSTQGFTPAMKAFAESDPQFGPLMASGNTPDPAAVRRVMKAKGLVP